MLVGGVLMASSLVELYFSYRETQRAIVRVERAKAVAAAAGIEQFLKEVEQQVRETTRHRVRRSRREPGGTAGSDFARVWRAAMAEQRELDFLRVLRNVPAVARAEPSRPRRQGAASRLSPGPGRRRQPGRLFPGAQVRRGAGGQDCTGVPSISRTSRSRT